MAEQGRGIDEGQLFEDLCELTRDAQARALVVSGHLPQVDPLSPRHPGRVATLAKPLTTGTLSAALSALTRKDDDDTRSHRLQP